MSTGSYVRYFADGVMVSAATARKPFPAFLYVDVADSTYRRALAARATGLERTHSTRPTAIVAR